MAGEKILVVDHDQATSKLVALVLLPKGYEVRHAASADQALTAIEKECPDLPMRGAQRSHSGI